MYVDISKRKEVTVSISLEGEQKTKLIALEESIRGVNQRHLVCDIIDTVGYYLTREDRNEITDIIGDQGSSIIAGLELSIFSQKYRKCDGGKIMLFAKHAANNEYIKTNSKIYSISSKNCKSVRAMTKDSSGMSNLALFNDFASVLNELKAGIVEADDASNKLFIDLLWLLDKMKSAEKIHNENFARLSEMVKNLSEWRDDLKELHDSLELWLKKSTSQTIYFKNICMIMMETELKETEGFDHTDALENANSLGHKVIKFNFNYLKFTEERMFTSCNCADHVHGVCVKPKCVACGKLFQAFQHLFTHLKDHIEKRNEGILFAETFYEIQQISGEKLLIPENLGFERIIVSFIIYINIYILNCPSPSLSIDFRLLFLQNSREFNRN